jgi:hypothetical protein
MRTAKASAHLFPLKEGSRDRITYKELECRSQCIDEAVRWSICVRFPGGEGLFGHCAQTGFGSYPIFCLVGTGPPPPHPGWVQKQDVESDCSSPKDLCEGACALVLPLRLRGLCLIVSMAVGCANKWGARDIAVMKARAWNYIKHDSTPSEDTTCLLRISCLLYKLARPSGDVQVYTYCYVWYQ